MTSAGHAGWVSDATLVQVERNAAREMGNLPTLNETSSQGISVESGFTNEFSGFSLQGPGYGTPLNGGSFYSHEDGTHSDVTFPTITGEDDANAEMTDSFGFGENFSNRTEMDFLPQLFGDSLEGGYDSSIFPSGLLDSQNGQDIQTDGASSVSILAIGTAIQTSEFNSTFPPFEQSGVSFPQSQSILVDGTFGSVSSTVDETSGATTPQLPARDSTKKPRRYRTYENGV